MTEGPIFSKMLRFVLPMIAVNLLQMFYNAADMMIVALSSEPDAVGAIGTTLAFINLVVNSFIGLSVGANVVLARAIGAGDEKLSHQVVHTAVVFSLLLGLCACGLGVGFCRPVLAAMGNEGKLLDLSARYCYIYFAGVPFLAVTNFAAAMLRASGDSTSPLRVLGLSGLFNVGMNLFFVRVCGLSVEGVSAATALANVLSSALLLRRLTRLNAPHRLRFSQLRIHKQALSRIARIGIPAGVQSALFAVSHLLIQSSILTVNNALVPPGAAYQPVVKGHSAANNLEGFAFTVLIAVSQASTTFIGQNAGAGKYDRVRQVRRCAYAMGLVASCAVGWGLLLCNRPLLSLYGVAPGDALAQLAYESALTRMRVMHWPYCLLAFMEIGSSTLQGLAKPMTATVITVCGTVVFRVLWILIVFGAMPTLTVIYLAFPIAWGLTAAAHWVAGNKQLKAVTSNA